MAGRGSPQADAHGLGALLLDGADSRTADAISWDFLSKVGGSSSPFSTQAHVWRPSSAATEGLSL